MSFVETPFFVDGPAGQLEAILLKHHTPSNSVAVICHPHPLKEGTMHNKVVHTLSRAFSRKGIDSVRFNYRGVGQSEGTFGDSVGEVADLMAVLDWVDSEYPHPTIYLAGFSFGAYIAAMGATAHRCRHLFSVAPAVSIHPFDQLPAMDCPWTIIQGENDEVVPPEAVYAWFESASQKAHAPMELIKLPDTTHFFHSKLIALRELVETFIL